MEAGFFYGDMVRLHVLAHSDREADQRLKLWVVQAIRRRAVRAVQGAADAAEAYERLYQARDALRRCAARAARRRGFFGPVAVEMGVFPFPSGNTQARPRRRVCTGRCGCGWVRRRGAIGGAYSIPNCARWKRAAPRPWPARRPSAFIPA